MQHHNHTSLPLPKMVPKCHTWKEKLQISHLKNPAKSSSSFTQLFQVLKMGRCGFMSCRPGRGPEDTFEDVGIN